ncbi:flippase-like domain-containing protein [Candidatus Woesearchaeota archaeon]|nr:flippase-like domain-containing protein [Candidatus Woesearchaeota archaeon]
MKLKKILPVIGIAIFVYIVHDVGIRNIISAIKPVKPLLLVPMTILLILIALLKSYKWGILLKAMKTGKPFGCVLKVWFAGFFLGLVTPGKIGDFFKVAYLKGRLMKSLTSVILDRILDIISLVILCGLSFLILSSRFSGMPQYGTVIIASAALIVLGLLIFDRRIMRTLLKPLYKFLLPKKHKKSFKAKFNEFYNELSALEKKRLIVPALLTVFSWYACFSFSYAVAVCLGLEISLGYIFLIMPVITLVEMLPISVSGLGTRDAALIFFFSAIGFRKEQAVAFSLANLVLGAWILGIAGIFSYMRISKIKSR